LEITESFQSSNEFDYIVVHRINPGQVQKVFSVKELYEAVAIVYSHSARDVPWSTKVSISFAPPWGNVLIDENDEMRFFAELPQAMREYIYKKLREMRAPNNEATK